MLHQVKGNLKKKTICGKVLNRTNFLVVSNAQLQNDDVFKKIFFFVRNLHLKRETLFFCRCFACVINKSLTSDKRKFLLKVVLLNLYNLNYFSLEDSSIQKHPLRTACKDSRIIQ
jgi:hypothetical protein